MFDDLFNDLDVLNEFDKEQYQKLEYYRIQGISLKGSYEGAALIDEQWIPKSQLRCDFDKNLYISIWFYEKFIERK